MDWGERPGRHRGFAVCSRGRGEARARPRKGRRSNTGGTAATAGRLASGERVARTMPYHGASLCSSGETACFNYCGGAASGPPYCREDPDAVYPRLSRARDCESVHARSLVKRSPLHPLVARTRDEHYTLTPLTAFLSPYPTTLSPSSPATSRHHRPQLPSPFRLGMQPSGASWRSTTTCGSARCGIERARWMGQEERGDDEADQGAYT